METIKWASYIVIAFFALFIGYKIGFYYAGNQECIVNPAPVQHNIELTTDCQPVECKCEPTKQADLTYCLSHIKQAKKFEKDLKEIR